MSEKELPYYDEPKGIFLLLLFNINAYKLL